MKLFLQRFWVMVFCLIFLGCRAPTLTHRRIALSPPTVDLDSASLPSLKEKVMLLEQYVAFRRTYETLDFDLTFFNGSSGGVPGPSEWDIRLAAKVPDTEIEEWVMGMKPTTPSKQAWLKTIPTQLKLTGIQEWYEDGRRIVGVDRQAKILVYRNWAN